MTLFLKTSEVGYRKTREPAEVHWLRVDLIDLIKEWEMFKVVGLLKRSEGIAIEEFKNWWLKNHAEKVKK